MIISDVPVFTRDASIADLSQVKHSNLSRYSATAADPSEGDLRFVQTASFGNVVISSDARCLGGSMVGQLQLLDSIQINPSLTFGTSKIPSKIMTLLEENLESDSGLLLSSIDKMLSLDECESRVALRYLRRMFEVNGKASVRGEGHQLVARTIQVLGWKFGVHSSIDVTRNYSDISFSDDCPLTIIDFDGNRVHSKVIELKIIPRVPYGARCYKISSTGLPVLPTLAGMFSF